MPTQVLLLAYEPGASLTCNVTPLTGGGIVNSTQPLPFDAPTNPDSLYAASLTDAAAGTYQVDVYDPTNYLGTLYVDLSGVDGSTGLLMDAPTPGMLAAAIPPPVIYSVTPATINQNPKPFEIITIRGVTLNQPLINLGSLTGWAAIYFTVKAKGSDLDSAAILQIKAINGSGSQITVLNGATPANPSYGSLAVTDITGAVLVTVAASVMASLLTITRFWDIKIIYNDGPPATERIPMIGEFNTKMNITQAAS